MGEKRENAPLLAKGNVKPELVVAVGITARIARFAAQMARTHKSEPVFERELGELMAKREEVIRALNSMEVEAYAKVAINILFSRLESGGKREEIGNFIDMANFLGLNYCDGREARVVERALSDALKQHPGVKMGQGTYYV